MTDPMRELARLRYQTRPGRWEALAQRAPTRRPRRVFWVLGAAAAAAVAWLVSGTLSPHLDVELSGAGGARTAALTSRWLETAPGEQATVSLRGLGTVTVEPNSRLRLTTLEATRQRLELARGVIHARVDAPPRLFVVATPQAEAVDLGCAYTLRVSEAGTDLVVEAGLVALEGGGVTSTVLAGMHAQVRPGRAPGTPLALDAPAALVDAVARIDASGDESGLSSGLAAARNADAATLWHLAARGSEASRAAAADALATRVSPPSAWAPHAAPSETALRAWWNTVRAVVK